MGRAAAKLAKAALQKAATKFVMPTRGAKRCLKAVASIAAQPPTRQLASLLFEFMAPGQRHPGFRPDCAVKPFVKKSKYRSGVVFVHKFQAAYEDPYFAEYIRHGGYMLQDFTEQQRSALNRDAVPFEIIASEFRRCQAIIDWFYIGVNASWFGNSRHLHTAMHWLMADDAVRRRSLLEIDAHLDTCPLTKSFVKALGQNYQLRLPSRVKHLSWVCEQPFLHKDKYFMKTKLNFNLARRDAKYLVLLYGLKPRLEHKALQRFEEAGAQEDPAFMGRHGRRKLRLKKQAEKAEKMRLESEQRALELVEEMQGASSVVTWTAAQKEAMTSVYKKSNDGDVTPQNDDYDDDGDVIDEDAIDGEESKEEEEDDESKEEKDGEPPKPKSKPRPSGRSFVHV